MAAIVILGAGTFSTANGTKTVTATPTFGDLIVIVTAHTANTSAALPTDDNADGRGTYTEISACAAVKSSSTGQMRVFIRNSLIGSATSTIFTHAPGTTDGGGLSVFRVTGLARTGAAAARQGAKQDNIASGVPTPVLSVAALTGNAMLGVAFNTVNPAALTARTSPAWTEHNDLGYNNPTTGFQSMTIDSGETGTSIAWGSSSATTFGSMVLELDCSAEQPLPGMVLAR